MPQRAPHPCHWPNCAKTVRQGAYCDEHRQRRDRQYNADHEEKKFYRRATWRKFRLAFLWQNPLCVVCFEKGQLVPAEHVDHVIPRKVRPDLELDPENCQALCASCHSRKTLRQRYHG